MDNQPNNNSEQRGISQAPPQWEGPQNASPNAPQNVTQNAPQSSPQSVPPVIQQSAPQTTPPIAPQWGMPQQQYVPQMSYAHPATMASKTKRPKRRFRNFMKTAGATVSFLKGVLVIILIFMLIGVVGSFFVEPVYSTRPEWSSFSVISIEGTIAGERTFGEGGYDHAATLDYIRALAYNSYDRGILLYMNTPGGTVYHSEELRLALLEYKKISGRPVYVYMAEVCASGGYWISMAADHVAANQMTITGSIGVVSTYLDMSELFENLGIRTVVIDTGEHKSTGTMGVEITQSQEAVIRSMIDEYKEIFLELVADGRNMDMQTTRTIADGRIYTASQALDLRLIDEIKGWDTAVSDFEALTGVPAFYPYLVADTSFWGALGEMASRVFPRSEADIALSAIEALPRGVPLVVAPELAG